MTSKVKINDYMTPVELALFELTTELKEHEVPEEAPGLNEDEAKEVWESVEMVREKYRAYQDGLMEI